MERDVLFLTADALQLDILVLFSCLSSPSWGGLLWHDWVMRGDLSLYIKHRERKGSGAVS